MSRLSATQRLVLADLAAGGCLQARWDSTAYYCHPADPAQPSYTVTFATKHALEQGVLPLIAFVPKSHPHEYRITAAGLDALTAATLPEAQP